MIQENTLRLKQRINSACRSANRDPGSIITVAVSKTRSAAQLREVIEAGITDIGENRIQEAIQKYQELANFTFQAQRTRWHLVGHLQTNKVKKAVGIFDLIQSVDSIHLASEIDRQAAKINKVQDVLVQIKTSPEVTKFGVNPKEAAGTIKEMVKFKSININGLMTIAPMVDNPEKARPYFALLRKLLESICSPE